MAPVATHAQPGRPATPVQAAAVVAREVPDAIRLVGTVRADKRAVIASEMEGLVASFPAAEGDFLKAGQPICELEATAAELRLVEARGELDRLKAQLEEIENGERVEVLSRLEAAVGEAEAQLKLWQFERERIADLFARNQSNAKEKNDAEAEYLAADRRLAQAQAALLQARNGARPEERARARLSVAVQAAVVQRAERDLRLTRVLAPFDGFVIAKRCEVGEWMDRGGPVCEMVAIETVKVRADAPESVVRYAIPGAAASIEAEALGLTRTGKVARLIQAADASARTFPVEIDLDNADHQLLPGMFVWAYVPAGPPGERLMAPKDAIVAQGLSKTVFVVRALPDGSRMAMPMPATTGLELAGEVEIKVDGLQAGDLVVTRANERLFGPTPVSVKDMLPPPGQPPTGMAQGAPPGQPQNAPTTAPADQPGGSEASSPPAGTNGEPPAEGRP